MRGALRSVSSGPGRLAGAASQKGESEWASKRTPEARTGDRLQPPAHGVLAAQLVPPQRSAQQVRERRRPPRRLRLEVARPPRGRAVAAGARVAGRVASGLGRAVGAASGDSGVDELEGCRELAAEARTLRRDGEIPALVAVTREHGGGDGRRQEDCCSRRALRYGRTLLLPCVAAQDLLSVRTMDMHSSRLMTSPSPVPPKRRFVSAPSA